MADESMLTGWEAAGAATAAVAAMGRPLVAVVDPVALAAADGRLRTWLDALSPDVVVEVGRGAGPASIREVADLAARCSEAAGVVAVGGGRALDAAKIAVSGLSYLELWFGQRAGSDMVTPVQASVPLLAVPTTVGTGCEVSPKAMMTTAAGRLLLIGDNLRPTIAWAIPEVLGSLPTGALPVAGLEIIGRLLGPWVGVGRDVPAEPAAMAARVVDAVDGIARRSPVTPAGFYGRRPGGTGGALRLGAYRDLFAISAAAHLENSGPPGLPCSYWLWPLANEWSTLTGGPKMQGLLDLLPAWLDWVIEHSASAAVAEAGTRWRSTVDRWCAVRSPADAAIDPEQVLYRVETLWRPVGAGLPPRSEIRRVLLEAAADRRAA